MEVAGQLHALVALHPR